MARYDPTVWLTYVRARDLDRSRVRGAWERGAVGVIRTVPANVRGYGGGGDGVDDGRTNVCALSRYFHGRLARAAPSDRRPPASTPPPPDDDAAAAAALPTYVSARSLVITPGGGPAVPRAAVYLLPPVQMTHRNSTLRRRDRWRLHRSPNCSAVSDGGRSAARRRHVKW